MPAYTVLYNGIFPVWRHAHRLNLIITLNRKTPAPINATCWDLLLSNTWHLWAPVFLRSSVIMRFIRCAWRQTGKMLLVLRMWALNTLNNYVTDSWSHLFMSLYTRIIYYTNYFDAGWKHFHAVMTLLFTEVGACGHCRNWSRCTVIPHV